MSINDIPDNYRGNQDTPFSALFIDFARRKKERNTEEENIRPIDIKDFRDSQHTLDYIDNDSATVNSLEGIPDNNDIVRLECFIIAVCMERYIQLDINYRTYQPKAGDLLLNLPDTVISHTILNPKYKIGLVGFSTRFLQRIIKMERETWNTAVHIRNNPVKSVSGEENNSVFGFHRDLIVAKINDEPHCYHREVMQHLFSVLFYEMSGQLHRKIEYSDKSNHSRENIKQVNYTLQKFMELLSGDRGIHRSASYFVNKLCYTSGHFSRVIKQACDGTPSDLINETVMEQIKYRLKHPDKSIREITKEFNFPNQSFFEEYVKAHLETSPANYRSRKKDI